MILCCFAGVVAPNYFREPLRLVLLVVISIFLGFCLIRAGACFCLNFISTGLGSCSLRRNKVGGWLDLVGHEFWVWSNLDVGTASLKLRQFKSAVCDAFGMFVEVKFALYGVCGVCSLLCGVLGLRATCFLPMYCWVGGWGLVYLAGCWVVGGKFLLHTCILFTRMCTASTTGHITWGVVF